jgi:RNA polymerase sigma factor (sigma-70 family)
MDVTAIGPVSAAVSAALAAAFERGRIAHPSCSLARAVFDEEVLVRVRRRFAGAAHSGDRELAAAIDRLASADVYLALACEHGVPGAWERFDARHRPRLREQARRLGAASDLAEELAADVLAELCAPPAERGARTRLSRYDGSGSLEAWLALIVRHRLVDRVRVRRPAAGPGAGPERAFDCLPDPSAGSPDQAAIAGESAALFVECAREAFAHLTPKESLALQFRYADELAQKKIAGLLGVGEPRVTRLLQAAVERLREGLRRCWRFLVSEGGGTRPLAELLRSVLAERRAPLRAQRGGAR